jgi:Xaa-Pro dipeptidase
MTLFQSRLLSFRNQLEADGIDVALITDDDNIYYLTGYYDYLHMEFGRPTILVVPRDADSLLITPQHQFQYCPCGCAGRSHRAME